MIRFTVHTLDEFGRMFGQTTVISEIQGGEQAIINVNRFVFEALCRNILRQMGEAARADWYGETVEHDFRTEAEWEQHRNSQDGIIGS